MYLSIMYVKRRCERIGDLGPGKEEEVKRTVNVEWRGVPTESKTIYNIKSKEQGIPFVPVGGAWDANEKWRGNSKRLLGGFRLDVFDVPWHQECLFLSLSHIYVYIKYVYQRKYTYIYIRLLVR